MRLPDETKFFVVLVIAGLFIPFFLISTTILKDNSDCDHEIVDPSNPASQNFVPKSKYEALRRELDATKTLVDSFAPTSDKSNSASSSSSSSSSSSQPNILSSEQSLLLEEIPFIDPYNLQDSSLDTLKPYELYRKPSEDWIDRASPIFAEAQEKLKKAQQHVDDPEQRVTLVASLLDLGRDKLQNVGQFKRSFDEYIQRFQRTVNVDFPMIVFMDSKHVSSLNLDHHKNSVIIIPISVEILEKQFPNYFRRIEEIRQTNLYKRQAKQTGWLEFAPQAALKDYNLLVMTKPFFLRWASMINPFRTQYFLFVDAGHDCIGALQTTHLNPLRRLLGKMLVSYFDYKTGLYGETHGMPQMAFRHYVGAPHNNEKTWGADRACCKVVRGGIFGGTPAYIDAFAKIYNVILSQTLSDGYMGTEENILAIVLYRFPELFNAYHNHDGDNCRLFVDTSNQKNEADRDVYVHGDVVDSWDSITKTFKSDNGHRVPLVRPTRPLRG